MLKEILPPVRSVPELPTDARIRILDLLFEPCTQLHTLSLDSLLTEHFSSYDELISHVGTQLNDLADSSSASDKAWLDTILGAHPRLGDKKVDSAQSKSEQAHLQSGGTEEAQRLAALNEEYEIAFPRLRYVVFVNGRSRPQVMQNMRERIDRNDIELERAEAIKAMCDIARDRAKKLLN